MLTLMHIITSSRRRRSATVGCMDEYQNSQHPLSFVACNSLYPDKPVHAMTLSNQHIFGQPRLLDPPTSPAIKVFQEACYHEVVSSRGQSITVCKISRDSTVVCRCSVNQSISKFLEWPKFSGHQFRP